MEMKKRVAINNHPAFTASEWSSLFLLRKAGTLFLRQAVLLVQMKRHELPMKSISIDQDEQGGQVKAT